MSKYGPGVKLSSAFCMDKDELRHALMGQVIVGSEPDEEGFEKPVYGRASRADCAQAIMNIFDNAVYQTFESVSAGNAMEQVNSLYDCEDVEKRKLAMFMKIHNQKRVDVTGDYRYDDGDETRKAVETWCQQNGIKE